MSFRRTGLSFLDKDPRRAEQDRDLVAAVQDLQGMELEVTAPATANQEFILVHKLGHVPRAIETLRTLKGGIVYASRIINWDQRRVFAKCTVASDELLLRVR